MCHACSIVGLQPELPSCPPDRLPSEQWERDVAMAFLDMRQSLGRLSEKHAFNRQRAIKVPPLKHETAWLYFLYGSQKVRPKIDWRPFITIVTLTRVRCDCSRRLLIMDSSRDYVAAGWC